MALDPSVLDLIRVTVRETLKQLRSNPPTVPATLNTSDAAHHLGISPSKLSRLRHEGKGPPFVRIGAAVRFKTSDLDSWLTAQCERGQHKGPVQRFQKEGMRNE